MNDNKINLDELGDLNFNDIDLSGSNEKNNKTTDNNKIEESKLLNELSDLANQATKNIKQKEQERIKNEKEKEKVKENNKYIIIGIIVAVLICFTIAFSSCGKHVNRHGGKTTPANKTINEFSGNSNQTRTNYNMPSGNSNTQRTRSTRNQKGFESNPM